LGLRNPFSIAFSDAGRLYINDVGQDAAEEINIGVAGGNYGWPVAEGNDNGDPRYRDPIYNYSHDDGCAIVGAAVYEPGADNFPPGYVGKYFFADLCDGEIRYLNPDTNRVSPFATGVTGPTALTVSPTGELYYLQSRGENGSTLRKISYSTTVNVTLKLNTSVPGLTLNIDDQFVTGPAYVNATAGSVRTLSAPPTQVLNGITYNFVSWSDNGAATHNVRVPGNPITYLARYEREGPGASLSPLPPTAVRVDTVTGRRQLNFFWNDRADNESGYKVERSRNGGAFTLIAQVGADANRYFDLPPAAGEYTYRVRGFNAYGHSAYSAEISATVA
jgi:hypothetical protein